MINYNDFDFAPVVDIPEDYHVFDFTQGAMTMPKGVKYAVGKYNEHRPDIYKAEHYSGSRDYHIGLDLFGPEDTEIHSFYDGVIDQRKYNDKELDYGHTLVVRYELGEEILYALYGHLSKRSYDENPPGKIISRGDVIAWMGNPLENGGWPPHLHLQLSKERPVNCDVPGVVSKQDLEVALQRYPDPQLVTGKFY